MKRLGIVFIATLVIGTGIYLVVSFLTDKKEEDTTPSVSEPKEITYEFNFDYGTTIQFDELASTVKENSEAIILIGSEKEEATKKVSSLLGNIENISNEKVYYIEREDSSYESAYQELISLYPELSSYLNFTPVLLVFKDNTFVGGLPGEVEEKNITNFLEYTEVLK